ncbi:MAG: ABC transporter ATP-binding protein [Solobacterium sp.]|nr:ABC transporter ATP-binding protein [Solobacterium sp.]
MTTKPGKRPKSDRVLMIRDLNISFETANGKVNAIRGVRMDLYRGETIAIVGESGSGKSVTVKTIMGILAPNGKIESGRIDYTFTNDKGEKETVDMTKLSQKEIRYRFNGKHIAMVFQDPMTSLDPTMTIGKQITEGMILHEHLSKDEAEARAIALLQEVGIENPEKRFRQYPHQLSGGMRQRVVIAIALACNPDILICDEPTTALDVTIQAKILELIKKIQKEKNISVIYITHDLGVVAKVADYVDVMYAGRIIEKGNVDEVFYDPKHPYTWGLLASMPDTDTDSTRLFAIPGTPPDLLEEIVGDAFAPRNPYALAIDYKAEPPMFNVGGHHRVASWLYDPRAPKVELPEQLKERLAKMKAERDRLNSAMEGAQA